MRFNHILAEMADSTADKSDSSKNKETISQIIKGLNLTFPKYSIDMYKEKKVDGSKKALMGFSYNPDYAVTDAASVACRKVEDKLIDVFTASNLKVDVTKTRSYVLSGLSDVEIKVKLDDKTERTLGFEWVSYQSSSQYAGVALWLEYTGAKDTKITK